MKLSAATDVVQVSVVSDESKSRNTFLWSMDIDRALGSDSPSTFMLLLEVWLLSIPLLAFGNISPSTPGILLLFHRETGKTFRPDDRRR